MTVRPDFPLESRSALPGIGFAGLSAVILKQARQHDLPVLEQSENRLTVETGYGHYGFCAENGAVSTVIRAPRADWLYVLQESLAETLAAFAPETAAQLSWTGSGPAGGLPPNFRFITVQSVVPAGPDFLRVTARAADLTQFGDDAIHFRLILPPGGLAEPEWPRLSEGGTTIWPAGDKTLHKPVYTLRRAYPASGQLVFDVFLHEGGQTTDWARAVQPGACVGMTGPGGGGIPEAGRITLYADETGLPAVARILETLPPSATGKAVLMSAAGRGCGYPVPQHPGIPVTWHTTGAAGTLAELAIADRAAFADHFLWFAGEKEDAQRMRAYCKRMGMDAKANYISAYWTRG